MRSSKTTFAVAALALLCPLFASSGAPAYATTQAAESVIGQSSFTNGSADAGGSTSATGFNGPMHTAIDRLHSRMFISDRYNNRVLVYSLDASGQPLHTYADHVIGQADMSSNGWGTSQSTLHAPFNVVYEASHQRLYVDDFSNRRVLVFDVTNVYDGMPAAFVIGESDFTSSGAALSQTGMSFPYALALDESRHRLFVADVNFGRVLVFNTNSLSNGMAATNVIGQPDFTSASLAATRTLMINPVSLAYDRVADVLYVGDVSANRVLTFDGSAIADGMAATNVLGQTTFTATGTSTSAVGLDTLQGIAVDSIRHRLFVGDYGNDRVVVYNVGSVTDGMAAVQVLGQPNFTSRGASLSQTGFNSIQGLSFDESTMRLHVAELNSNRVSIYNMSSIEASTTVNAVVDPTLTFVVGGRSSSCNGVSLTSTASTGASVPLGHVTASANGVAAQDLAVTTNAAGGFTVYLRDAAQINDGNGHLIADVSGDNPSPGAFPSLGSAGFGYTTSDATLNGTVDRFTNPSANWAKLTTANQPVSFASSGPVTADTACVAYRLGVAPNTPAGTYSTTVIYTAVPVF